LVLKGSCVVAGKVCGRLSDVFLPSGEQAPAVAAGADGVELLLLYFPEPTTGSEGNPAETAE
jgi:hypothetical protein